MQIYTYYDRPRFAPGAVQLRRTLAHWAWADRLTVGRKLPACCAPHGVSPYGFKPHLLHEARRSGARLVLWADTSMRFLADPGWAEQLLEEEGVLLVEDSDQLLRWWSSDRALEYFGVKRVELGDRRDLLSGLLGLNFERRQAQQFLDAWLDAERAGVFRGAWSNAGGVVSSDPEVKGHRHDQTCATLIAGSLGLRTHTDRELGVASWSDHAERCGAARVIIDRKRNCPYVGRRLAALRH